MAGSSRTHRSRRPVVAALIAPGLSVFEFGIPCEVFGYDRSDELGVPWYRLRVCAPEAGLVPTEFGFSVEAPYGLEGFRGASTIVVSPFKRPYPPEALDALRVAHKRGARVVTMCSGAFVLAAAGLLDGRRATTHWNHADRLRREHPLVQVEPDVLFVDEGDVMTSAGTAAGIDLCLHIVRKDFGADIANAVARDMVIPPLRSGGQAQFIERPINDLPGSDLFAEALTWAEAHLGERITIDELASCSAMSPRTFARRFREVTGTTPHQWLTGQRVQLAQRLLETTDLPIDHIASECGFGTPANLRLHFQRIMKTSPAHYRRTFACA